MVFLNQIVSLVSSMRSIWGSYLYYVLALSFLATFPYIVYNIFNGGRR